MKLPRKILTKATVAVPLQPKGARTTTPKVSLKLVAPSAQNVCVVGTFNDWQATPLKPASGGVWASELKLAPGRYEYLFVVDGQWLPDPSAREAVPNPFGGLNSVMSVA